MHARSSLAAAAVLASCLACATKKEPAAPIAQPSTAEERAIGYRCPDQTGFTVTTTAGEESVSLSGFPEGPITLPRVRSGSGARFADGTTSYWSKGDEAMLELRGRVFSGCKVVADPAKLPGSRWRLARMQSMDDSESVPDDPSRYTLELGADGRVSGRADCNRFHGGYSAKGAAITLGPLATTRAMCPPESLSDRYVRALDSAASWMLTDDVLTIAMKADGGILHFERAP